LCGSLGYAAAKLEGWVTSVDPATQTIQIDGQTVSTRGLRIIGGVLEPGAYVSIEERKIDVELQRRPEHEQLIRYIITQPGNPGRVEFSHHRHFNALGEKQCQTCHTPEMGLMTSPTYASPAPDPSYDVHTPASRGRYCATCHNGVTRLSQVGVLRERQDTPLFTAFKSNAAESCRRCHAPADHGSDFTAEHGDVVEKIGRKPCLPCHAQDWGRRDRQALAEFLTAEAALKANPADVSAARVVGPNNFCVYCHRTDTDWLE
jgi:hypothetical protein